MKTVSSFGLSFVMEKLTAIATTKAYFQRGRGGKIKDSGVRFQPFQ
jgi:hypothetical protein